MRIDDFIAKCVSGEQKRARSVASVYFDGKTVYSYGHHYPLLVKIAGKWLLNDRGYSATTGKHIGHAKNHADFVMPFSYRDYRVDVKTLLETVISEIKELTEQLSGLSKRAFRQKQILDDRITELTKTKTFLASN